MADNQDLVHRVFAEHWGGGAVVKLIKASQNYTYEATNSNGEKCIVRAVPNGTAQRERVEAEVALLQFIAAHNAVPALRATTVIPAADGRPLVHHVSDEADVLLLCFTFAEGRAVDFMSWEFFSNKEIVVAVGAAIGRLHSISRQLPAELSARFRGWRELHDGVLRDATVCPEDAALESDPDAFGVTHGDVNLSNLFLIERDGRVCDVYLFDWDQSQRAWFAFDLAQVIHGTLMLQWAGFMGIECPVQNLDNYIEWILEGYNATSLSPKGPVDRQHLFRMIALRRDFYLRFARRELANPSLPKEMHDFCKFIQQYGETTQERFDAYLQSKK